MSFSRGFLVSLCMLAAIIGGCNGTGSDASPMDVGQDTSTSDEVDSVVTLLQTADTTALHEAFAARNQINYFRRSRTRQIHPATEDLIASYELLIKHVPENENRIELVKADSSGSFTLGFFSSFMRPTLQVGMLANPAPHLVPDDPAYLGNRGPSLYQYELLPDTVIAGRPTAVARITLKPTAGEDQQIRAGRFYIDRSTGSYVGISLLRRQKALLFSEESTLEVYIQHNVSTGWFPDRTSYRTKLDIPFITSKHLTTEAQYFTQSPGG